MHGRLKVRTTEEQKQLKKIEQQKKLAAYRSGMKQILDSRKPDTYDPTCFALCAQLLMVNPDIYTLWNYRKEVVMQEINKSKETENGEEELSKLLEDELKLTEQCLLANPKSYGSWHHRHWIMLHHPKADWQKEFNLCTRYLCMDDRNFHSWDYRRIILKQVAMSRKDEIQFSRDRINANFSNYSSWHYRSTLLEPNDLHDELMLVKSAIFTDPTDSSAWFYLRWVLSHDTLTKEEYEEFYDELNQLQELEPNCKWILITKCWLIENVKHFEAYKEDKMKFYKQLEELDSMRRGQYEHRQKVNCI